MPGARGGVVPAALRIAAAISAAVLHQYEILAGREVQAVDARWRADHRLAHRHGFQHFDIGAGRRDQRRDHHRGTPVRGPHVGDEAFQFDAGLSQVGGYRDTARGAAPAMMCSVHIVQQRPHFVQEKLHGHHVGPVGEAADEEHAPRRPARLPRAGSGPDRRRWAGRRPARAVDRAAVLLAHRDHAVHRPPGGGFEAAPEVQFAAQFPVGRRVSQASCSIEIERDVVLHQDGAGGRAIGGVLRELREFQLRDGGTPLADGLLQGGAEGWANRIPPPPRDVR